MVFLFPGKQQLHADDTTYVTPDDTWSIEGRGGGQTQAGDVAQLQIITAMNSFHQSIWVAARRGGQSSGAGAAPGGCSCCWLPAKSP